MSSKDSRSQNEAFSGTDIAFPNRKERKGGNVMTNGLLLLYALGFLAALVFLYDTIIPKGTPSDLQGLVFFLKSAALALFALSMTMGGIMTYMSGKEGGSQAWAGIGKGLLTVSALILIAMAVWALMGRAKQARIKGYSSLGPAELSRLALDSPDQHALAELARRDDPAALETLAAIANDSTRHLSLRLSAVRGLGNMSGSVAGEASSRLEALVKKLEQTQEQASEKPAGETDSQYLIRECRQALDGKSGNDLSGKKEN